MNQATRTGAALLPGLLLAAAAALAAGDPFLGTWVLNAAQSKAPIGAVPRAGTVTVTSAGAGRYKSVSETAIGGATMRGEITFGIDGKDYKAEISPAPPGMQSIVQSFERVNGSAYKTTVKVNGQAIATTLNEVSADGRTLTLTTTGAGALASSTTVTVFDKR